MKKIVSFILVLVLCLSAVALAEAVPSKNTSDMVTVELDAELNPQIPTDSGLLVLPVLEEDEEHAEVYAERIEVCQEEIARLAEAVSSATDTSGVETYFGEVRDSQGNVIVLSEVLEAQALNVYEFMPLVVASYEETYGNVTVLFQFKTPYAQDERVLVLIGIMNVETEEMEWTAFEGVGVGEDGAVQVEFTPEILTMIQENIALLAVVSAAETEGQ